MKYNLNNGIQPVPDGTLVDLIFADGGVAYKVDAGMYSWDSLTVNGVQVDRIIYWRLCE